jgi:hypothetical protein
VLFCLQNTYFEWLSAVGAELLMAEEVDEVLLEVDAVGHLGELGEGLVVLAQLVLH